MKMARVRVEGFTISLDGYGAGPNQDISNPLGVGGSDLHQWLVPTRTIQRTLFGVDGGTTGIDDEFAARGFKNVGAWILGRNMFGPIRGAWPDLNWKGWWGDNPPYHVPTFILTHHARPPIQMEGGTTFHFVTGGIHAALERARDAANGMDVRVGGGPDTIQQYLRAGLIDELHFAISPVLLGAGERLFEGIDVRTPGYECVQFVASEKATHVVLLRKGHHDARPTFGSVSDYVSALEPPQAKALKRVIAAIQKSVPGSSRVISYGIPAFKQDRVFIYCGAFKHHISIFPPVRGNARLQAAVKPYANAKGSLRFNLDQPLPLSLLSKVAKALAKQRAQTNESRPKRKDGHILARAKFKRGV
jgi:dihydrofolate reductase/uncharacterized protein YdhG (YjbR/CyaY superfamily)